MNREFLEVSWERCKSEGSECVVNFQVFLFTGASVSSVRSNSYNNSQTWETYC